MGKVTGKRKMKIKHQTLPGDFIRVVIEEDGKSIYDEIISFKAYKKKFYSRNTSVEERN
jgi:hypothetical protein